MNQKRLNGEKGRPSQRYGYPPSSNTVHPRAKGFEQPNNMVSIESRKYSTGVSLGIFRSNNEVRHSLDSTLIRSLINQGVVGSGQYSTYNLYFCKNRESCLCLFRLIERRDQYSGSSVFSLLEYHSVECVHSETRHRKGEISEAEFFPKKTLDVTSSKGNRGGSIIVHKGKVHRNKGRSSSEYRRFFCKEKDCSHRIIERKSDGKVCIRGFHDCLREKSPKKSNVRFHSKSELCVSITNGHLKGGKPAKNLICNGCLFLSNRKNVVLGGRKFEENTVANEYICQIKNQFKRNRNRDRSDFHCNAIVKERISDGRIILQGHHDPKCLHISKKFYAPEVHGIKPGEGETISVKGIIFCPLSTRSMKFGKEEVSVMEYMCSMKTSFSHVNCSAVVFKHLEYDTYFVTGRHDKLCVQMKNERTKRVLPILRILSPPTPGQQQQLVVPPPPVSSSSVNTSPKPNIRPPLPPSPPRRQQHSNVMKRSPSLSQGTPPPPPPPRTRSKSKRKSGRNTRNSQRRSLVNTNNKDPNQVEPSSSSLENGNRSHNRNKRNHHENQKKHVGFKGIPRSYPQVLNPIPPNNANFIPELRILSVYPGIVDRSGSTINLLLKCPPNFSQLIQPNLMTVYFTEAHPMGGPGHAVPRSEVIPRSSFYFPSVQFSNQIGNEWGVGGATCRILLTLPFFFGLQGLLNLNIELPNQIRLEMKNALMISSNVDLRQNELQRTEKQNKKRKLVDLIIPSTERDQHHTIARNGSNMKSLSSHQVRNSRICCFFPNKPQSPKIHYAEIFMNLNDFDLNQITSSENSIDDIEVYFNQDQAVVLGSFSHKFGEKSSQTRYSKMYKGVYEEKCQDSNFIVTCEVPDFFISSGSIDLIIILNLNREKKMRKRFLIKNVFQVNDEEAKRDPFLMSLSNLSNLNNLSMSNVNVPHAHVHHHQQSVHHHTEGDDDLEDINNLEADFENLNMFRPDTPPLIKQDPMLCQTGAGFNRIESFDDLDSMVDL